MSNLTQNVWNYYLTVVAIDIAHKSYNFESIQNPMDVETAAAKCQDILKREGMQIYIDLDDLFANFVGKRKMLEHLQKEIISPSVTELKLHELLSGFVNTLVESKSEIDYFLTKNESVFSEIDDCILGNKMAGDELPLAEIDSFMKKVREFGIFSDIPSQLNILTEKTFKIKESFKEKPSLRSLIYLLKNVRDLDLATGSYAHVIKERYHKIFGKHLG
jgi:hypothetical protein